MSPSTSNPNSNSGGVRDLRAMFENKATEVSESPSPNRERSSSGSDPAHHSTPARKVRANFVSVESPAERRPSVSGLLPKASDMNNMAEAREEGTANGLTTNGSQHPLSTPPRSPALEAVTKSIEKPQENGTQAELDKKKVETSNDAPTLPPTVGDNWDLGAMLKGSSFDPSSPAQARNEESTPIDAPKSPVVQKKGPSPSKVKSQPTLASPPASGPKKNEKSVAAKKIEHPSATKLNPTKDARPIKVASTPQVRPSPSAPPSVASKTEGTPNTPTLVKAPRKGSAAKPDAVIQSAIKASEDAKTSPAILKKGSQASLNSSIPKTRQPNKAPAPLPSSNNTMAKKETTPSSPITKPKPHSPNRAGRLHSATAPTSASAARTTSGTHRSPSDANHATRPTSKKPLTSSGHRPLSKAPESTTSTLSKRAAASSMTMADGNERPGSRAGAVGKASEDGFLARMTRPTASSAQKVHGKVAVHSPPRKSRVVSGTKDRTRKSLGPTGHSKESAPEDKEKDSKEVVGESPATAAKSAEGYMSGSTDVELLQDHGEIEKRNSVAELQPGSVEQDTC